MLDPDRTPLKKSMMEQAEDLMPFDWTSDAGMAGGNSKFRIGRKAPVPPPEDFKHPLLQEIRDIMATTDVQGREKLSSGIITGRTAGLRNQKELMLQLRQKLIDAGMTPGETGRLGDLGNVTPRRQAMGESNYRNLEAIIHEAVAEGRIPMPEPPPPVVKPAPPFKGKTGPVQGPPRPVMAFDPATGEMTPQMPSRAGAAPQQGPKPAKLPSSKVVKEPPLPSSRVNLGPAAPSTRIPGETPLFLDVADSAAKEKKMFSAWQKANNRMTNNLPLSQQPQEPGSILAGVGGMMRNVMSSFDFSPLRQMAKGAPLNPKIAGKALGSGLSGMFSSERFTRNQNALKATPGWKMLADHGVVTELSENAPLSQAEEGFQGWASRFPLTKWFVNPSERGQVGALNDFRVNLANHHIKNGLIDPNNPTEREALAKMIGTFSGRGTFGAGMNQYVPALNAFAYSARYLKSKIDVMNPAYYADLYQKSPKVAKEAAKNALAATATYLGAAALAKYGLESAGVGSVGLDPTDRRNFMTATIGNSHYDLSFGQKGPLTVAAQVLTGESPNGPLNARARVETVGRFARGQEAPLTSAIHDLATGTKITGEKMVGAKIPFSGGQRTGGPFAQAVAERSLPLGIANLIEGAENQSSIPGLAEKSPMLGALMSSPDFIGMNTQTYDPDQDINAGIDPELLARWEATYGRSRGSTQQRPRKKQRRF